MPLERIFQEGTCVGWDSRNETINQWQSRGKGKPSNKIVCADGFKLSVVAGGSTYCSPRPDGFGSTSATYEGPFTAVEVGFPSARPEPWADWEEYCEDAESPTDTVYGWVPVETVRALVASHGGEA